MPQKKQVERNAAYQQKRKNTSDLVAAVGSQAICPNCKKIGKSNFLRRLFCGTSPAAEKAKKD